MRCFFFNYWCVFQFCLVTSSIFIIFLLESFCTSSRRFFQKLRRSLSSSNVFFYYIYTWSSVARRDWHQRFRPHLNKRTCAIIYLQFIRASLSSIAYTRATRINETLILGDCLSYLSPSEVQPLMIPKKRGQEIPYKNYS